MDKLNFDEKINTLQRNHGLFKKLLIMMISANVLLLMVLSTTIGKEKIILVPQTSPEYKLWISNTQVSNEYLAILSRNVLDLVLNITPSNVSAQHTEALKIVSSKYQALLKSRLDDIAKTVTQNNISQNFYIQDIRIINSKNFVYIRGSLNNYIDKTLASSLDQIYKLSFVVQNYGAQLTNLELLDNNDPQLRELQR